MKKYFSISEAAKMANTTSETLRHYDRIGLVTPSKKDEWTNYRYYTNQDIVRINTIRALQQMDLPLQEIKEILDYDDLNKIVDYLTLAEKKADEKINIIKKSKEKIKLAKSSYENKLYGYQKNNEFYIKEFPKRTIILSSLKEPTLDNLWNYHRHFYDIIDQELKDQFTFEDVAGIYKDNTSSHMFAICSKYTKIEELKEIPSGKYLCIDCTEETREESLNRLIQTAKDKYHTTPNFSIQLIVITGILKWNYQLQVLIEQDI